MYKQVKKRADFAQFMKLQGVEAYTLWGFGVESSGISYDIDEEETQYVVQRAPFTVQNSMSLSQDVEEKVYVDNPLFKAVDEIRRTHGMNEKASGKLLNCNLYLEEDLQPATAPAEEYDIIISITGFAEGEASEPLSISYSISYQSEPTAGTATFDWDAKTVEFAKTVSE